MFPVITAIRLETKKDCLYKKKIGDKNPVFWHCIHWNRRTLYEFDSKKTILTELYHFAEIKRTSDWEYAISYSEGYPLKVTRYQDFEAYDDLVSDHFE